MAENSNPKGAGRKPVPYKCKHIWVPLDLIPQVKSLIKDYKFQIKKGKRYDN